MDRVIKEEVYSSSTYSNMSPGWQLRYWHIAANVSKRTPFTFPLFSSDKLASVMPIRWASSFELTFLLANMTSKFTTIIIVRQTLDSRSVYLWLTSKHEQKTR